MIAYRFKRVRESSKYPLTAVFDPRRFPVQYFAGPGHNSSECLADRLVPQANAKDRRLAGEVPDDRYADSGLARRAGAGGDYDLVWRHRIDVLGRSFFVGENVDLGSELAQVLVEVVREAVVVVDQENHDSPLVTNSSRSKTMPVCTPPESLHTKDTSGTKSSGRPTRPDLRAASMSSSDRPARQNAVSVGPGAMAFTVTPYGATSWARARVRLITAALETP